MLLNFRALFPRIFTMTTKHYQPFLGYFGSGTRTMRTSHGYTGYYRNRYRNFKPKFTSRRKIPFYKLSPTQQAIIKNKHPAVEVKYFDDTTISGSIGQLPSNYSRFRLSDITRGPAAYERNGNNIWMKDLQIYWETRGVFTTNTHQRLFWAIIMIKEPFNADPFSDATWYFANTGIFMSPWNPDYRNTFVVYKQGIDHVDATGPLRVTNKFFIPIGAEATYSGNTGTYADDTKNSLWFICYSDDGTTPPTLNGGGWRLRFQDM